MRNRIWAIGVLIGLLVEFVSGTIPQVHAQTSFDQLKTGLGRVAAYTQFADGTFEEQSFGTGFFIDSETMITAAHVVLVPGAKDKNDQYPYVTVNIEDNTYPGEGIGAFAHIMDVDFDNDIAILKVLPMPFEKQDLRKNFWKHYSFSIATSEAKQGDQIRVTGYPNLTGSSLTITQGLISTVDNKKSVTSFDSDVITASGSSGSPAVNANDEVVGVVVSVRSSTNLNSQYTRIVSLSDVKTWLNDQKAKTWNNYNLSANFYNSQKTRVESQVHYYDADRTVTVSNSSGMSVPFSYNLPKNYTGMSLSSNSSYVVLNSEREEKVFIRQVVTPIDDLNEDLAVNYITFLSIPKLDWDKSNLTTIGGIQARVFELNTESKLYVGWFKNIAILVVVQNSDIGVIESLLFSTGQVKALYTPITSVKDYMNGISFSAPANYIIYQTESNRYNVINKGNVDDYAIMMVNYNTTLAIEIASLKQYYRIDSSGASDSVIVKENSEKNINGNPSYYLTIGSGSKNTAWVLIEDITHHRVIVLSTVYTTYNEALALRAGIVNTLTFARFEPNDTQINIGEKIKESDVVYTDGTQTTPLAMRTSKTSSTPTSVQSTPTQSATTSSVQPQPTASTTTTSTITTDKTLFTRLKGKILLQVEDHGKAWYISPDTSKRYYMSDGKAAYNLMRSMGKGISNKDLATIPTADSTSTLKSKKSICSTNKIAQRMQGQILLQVESKGEAWYIHPDNCYRIYLKDGNAAYTLMRELGLGISNKDIEKIQSN